MEIEQVLHLKQLLKAIHDDPELGPCYTLIGGTAINLFDPTLPRLSVDIDVDYLEPREGHFTKEIVPRHLDILRRLSSSLGMKPLDNDQDPLRSELMCVYDSNWTADTHMVKLDVSFLMKSMVIPPVMRIMPQLHEHDTTPVVIFSVASPEELWAGKTVAAVYNAARDPRPREAPRMISMHLIRHLYDLHRLHRLLEADAQTVDLDVMRRLFILKAVPRISDLFMLTGENIRKCDEAEWRKDLLPYLRTPREGSDGKTTTLKELMVSAREILNQVCSAAWTEREKEFVRLFQVEGQYEPALLFETGSPEHQRLKRTAYLSGVAQDTRRQRGDKPA